MRQSAIFVAHAACALLEVVICRERHFHMLSRAYLGRIFIEIRRGMMLKQSNIIYYNYNTTHQFVKCWMFLCRWIVPLEFHLCTTFPWRDLHLVVMAWYYSTLVCVVFAEEIRPGGRCIGIKLTHNVRGGPHLHNFFILAVFVLHPLYSRVDVGMKQLVTL